MTLLRAFLLLQFAMQLLDGAEPQNLNFMVTFQAFLDTAVCLVEMREMAKMEQLDPKESQECACRDHQVKQDPQGQLEPREKQESQANQGLLDVKVLLKP
ncbi:hypothetical protein R3I93_007445 [Phoxinus phoxinus]|uniref:Uncharacterized protein n=2 Tax=Phoxinus phoxinus TaxID=58324 RepID=A0AAN9H896_9TELE